MNLGRTFDLQTLQPGLDIFTDEALAKSKTIERYQTTIRYSVVRNSRDVNDILDVGGEISLKVKAGLLKIEGLGSYLKEDRSTENTLEILARAHVETMTETMTDSSRSSCSHKNIVGSHYIRSITYGGDLIVRIRIHGSDSGQFKDIKDKVEDDLNIFGFINAEAKAKFLKLEKEFKSSSRIEISYFSTTLQGTMPRDIDGMLQALDNFKDQVMKLNKGKGVPLTCELQPLNVLDPQFPKILKDKSLDVQLGLLEDNYDDVLQAKKKLDRFIEREDVDLDDDDEGKASELEDRIQDVIRVFNEVIAHLDVTTGGTGILQMQQAFDIYKKNKKIGGYKREVAKFLQSLQTVLQNDSTKTLLRDLPPGDRLDLVLLGKTGHGKSATGNSIFGEPRFNSEMSSSSVTVKVQKEFGTIGGREICLVDTPGTMDTNKPNETLIEVGTAIAKRPEGYHAFLIVLRIDARMTQEENMAIVMLKKMFGEDVLKDYGIFVFTHGDSFLSQQRKNKVKRSFQEFIRSQDGELEQLLYEAKYRCVLMNNMEQDPGILRDQVIELIKVVDTLRVSNGGKKYTNQLFESAQRQLQEEEQREREEVERKEQDRLNAAREEGRKEAESLREERVGRKLADEAYKKGSSCFPADMNVMLQSGETIKMKKIRIGDKVLSSVDDGEMEFSEVYFFAHRDEHGISSFINVSTARTELRLTPEHHIYLASDGHMHTVPAEEIKIGDHILILNTENNTLEEDVVMALSVSTDVGVYSPLTMSGTIIVNHALVSCYVDLVSPELSHSLLWPVRQMYRLSPALSDWMNTPGKDGMPVWVRMCLDYVILPFR